MPTAWPREARALKAHSTTIEGGSRGARVCPGTAWVWLCVGIARGRAARLAGSSWRITATVSAFLRAVFAVIADDAIDGMLRGGLAARLRPLRGHVRGLQGIPYSELSIGVPKETVRPYGGKNVATTRSVPPR